VPAIADAVQKWLIPHRQYVPDDSATAKTIAISLDSGTYSLCR
jgi:hypothetical protein